MSSQTITFGGGCFWCIEAVLKEISGIESLISGYAGGETEYPGYREVCSGTTGHAEVIQVKFNDEKISLHTLLEIFFTAHDPTTLNRQGADIGTQYRSVIFYHTAEQKDEAEKIIKEFDAAKIWPDPIVTEVLAAARFYPAEDYHQDYYRLNQNQQYCQLVISPKVSKIRKKFTALLNEN